mmetsp:Transcript_69082/g.178081  ORF Transcript_69082/g.178081 Transcript_69082/m.178081 type:complete len:373 (+) Transcript_69082:75-1193(+)
MSSAQGSSDGASEVGGPAAAPKGTGSMSNMIALTTRRNMAAINAAASSNIELQTLIMGAIAQYADATSKTGLGIQALTAKSKKAKDAADPDDAMQELNPNWHYHRNMTQWKKWGTRKLSDLLYYCDPTHMNRIFLAQFKDKDRMYELLEYAWDLKILHDNPDRVPTLNVKQLCESFKATYTKLGSRVAALVESIDGGHIDWQKLGHYSLKYEAPSEDKPDGVMHVTSKTMGQTMLVNPEVYKGDTNLATAVARRNSSQTEAYIMTKTDTYLIQNFFPRLSRSLRKRKTEEDHIAAAISGGGGKTDDDEKNLKKPKLAAKAGKPESERESEIPPAAGGAGLVALTADALEALEQEEIPSPPGDDEDGQDPGAR